MQSRLSRVVRHSAKAVLVLAALIIPGSPAVCSVSARPSPPNALYLLTLPAGYQNLETFIANLKDSGADTLIINPISEDGALDRKSLAKTVFFAHQAGLKLFVILPTRRITRLVEEHPDWEDMRYDLLSGTVQPAGKLDLFHPSVREYLRGLFKDVAGYSVDGIFLDQDFYYSDTEGMSGTAMDRYREAYDSFYSAQRAFNRIKGESAPDRRLEDYGEQFWNLAELKKTMLLQLLQDLMQSSKSVNRRVQFGVPLHIQAQLLSNRDVLAWYSHDVNALRKLEIPFFWLAIPHRDIRARQEISYKKTIEIVSRIVMSWISLLDDPASIVIAMQTTSRPRKLLPLSEIEDISSAAKRVAQTGLALMIYPDSQPPPLFTRKMFRRPGITETKKPR